MLMGALAATEMALSLAGIPHKKGGAQAAMDYPDFRARQRGQAGGGVIAQAALAGFACNTRPTNSAIAFSVARRVALRRMLGARQQRDLDRAIAFSATSICFTVPY